jgi:hypothetical protein
MAEAREWEMIPRDGKLLARNHFKRFLACPLSSELVYIEN